MTVSSSDSNGTSLADQYLRVQSLVLSSHVVFFSHLGETGCWNTNRPREFNLVSGGGGSQEGDRLFRRHIVKACMARGGLG